jgi:hypothetical protein
MLRKWSGRRTFSVFALSATRESSSIPQKLQLSQQWLRGTANRTLLFEAGRD